MDEIEHGIHMKVLTSKEKVFWILYNGNSL